MSSKKKTAKQTIVVDVPAGSNPPLEQHLEMMDAKSATAALDLKHATELKRLGTELIQSIVASGDKYITICKYIRTNCVPPKLVSFELSELGLNRQVVSRINKVANASDDKFSLFEARVLGFNKVLDLARGETVKQLAEAENTTEVDIKAIVEEMEKPETTTGLLTDEQAEKAKLETKRQRAVAALAHWAKQSGMKKQMTQNTGTGYIVKITKDPLFKDAKSEE